jgi:putative membrane protein
VSQAPYPSAAPPPELAPELAARQWRRLDRRMLLVHPIIEIGRLFPALIALIFFGRGGGFFWLRSLAIVAALIALGGWRWYTTTFRITPQTIELRRGLVRKTTFTAALDRVRTVDVTAHALHRALGLARVHIGTGVSDRKGHGGVTLDGLTAEHAGELREQLLHRTPIDHCSISPGQLGQVPLLPQPSRAGHLVGPAPYGSETEQEIVRLDRHWVRYAPFTLSGVLTGLAIAGFAWRLQSDTGGAESQLGPVQWTLHHLDSVSVVTATIEVTLALILFIALASTAGYILVFWNFRLTRHAGGSLHVSRGLVTTRATSIEERRLRGAELSEPLLLRAVGGARLIAIATGLRVGRGAERGGTVLMPPGPLERVQHVGAEVSRSPEAFTLVLIGHGRAAVRRRYVRAVGGTAVLAGVTITVTWHWWGSSSLIALLLLTFGAALAHDRAGSLGHALTDDHLVLRIGSLVRRRAVLSRAAVIGWTLRSSYFQRRADVLTLTATTAAGRQSYRAQDVPTAEAMRIADLTLPGLLDQFLVRPASSRGPSGSPGPSTPIHGPRG